MKISCKIPENLIVFVEDYLHTLACTNKLPQTSYNLVNRIVKLQGIKVAFTVQDWVFTCTLHSFGYLGDKLEPRLLLADLHARDFLGLQDFRHLLGAVRDWLLGEHGVPQKVGHLREATQSGSIGVLDEFLKFKIQNMYIT